MGTFAAMVVLILSVSGADPATAAPGFEAAQAQPAPDPAPTTSTTEVRPGNAGSAAGQAPSARLDPRLAQATFAGFGAALLLLLLRFVTAGFRVRRLHAKAQRKSARRANKERARAERLSAQRETAERVSSQQ